MKTLVLFFALVTSRAIAQNVDVLGAWIPVKLNWQKAPADIDPNMKTASARVLYFDNDHRFAIIGCWLIDKEPHPLVISAGDGQVVYYGSWNDQTSRGTKYRLISRTVQVVGEKLPGPEQSTSFAIDRKGHLLFDGKVYRKVEGLEKSVPEYLPRTFHTN